MRKDSVGTGRPGQGVSRYSGDAELCGGTKGRHVSVLLKHPGFHTCNGGAYL